jgi:hypothetical protein
MAADQRCASRSTISRWLHSLVKSGLFCLSLASATMLQAQVRRGTMQLRAGAALGLARTSVGGETSTDAGPLLIGQLGVATSSRTDLTLGLTVQPFKAHNPVGDEAYKAFYALGGLQLGLGKQRRLYLRPELGLVFRSWSGSQVVTPSETSLGVGLALGREWALSEKLGLAVEGSVRLSGADELSTRLIGLGLSLVPVGARPRTR